MRIVIIGAGEVGFYLAKRLSYEKHDLTIIDSDTEKCAKAQQALDIAVIEGSGADQEILKQAKAESSDMFIAASGIDETNLLSCMIASKMGAKRKIARVRNPGLYNGTSILTKKDLGVDLFIHPEEEVAEEITRLLMRSIASEIIEFENGKILVVGLKLDEKCPHLNKRLKEIGSEELRKNYRVVAISKGDRTIIPTGEDYINRNDQLFVMTKQENLPGLLSLTGKEDQKLEKIMILGGGKIGRGVASRIEQSGRDVTLIEADKEKSLKIAGQLKKTMVVQADGTEMDTLAREGILDMDAFVAVTADDETNIISCLLAKHLGIHKTIALVNKVDYLPLMSVIGIDSTVNVRISTANAILRLIRRGEILSVATFHDMDAEAIELVVKGESRITGKPLKKLNFPDGSLIAAIIRGENVYIPHGDSFIKSGDRVIVFALPQAISSLESKFS